MIVPVLMYHHVAPDSGQHTVTVDNFRSQLAFLKEHNIQALSLAEFNAWRKGQITLRGPAVLLTFDDAWLDNWVWAIPILQEFEMPAVFFVITSWPGEGEPRWEIRNGGNGWHAPSHESCMELGGTIGGDSVSMRWSELLAAKDSGLIDIASHSHTHGDWWHLKGGWQTMLSAASADLKISLDTLEQKTGSRPTCLCWPKGLFSPGLSDIARIQGFDSQFTTLRGGAGSGAEMIQRINVEDRPASWLEHRLRVYSNIVSASLLALIHQNLHRMRMRKRFPDLPKREFSFPILRLL